jgi:hypothetical protein
MSDRFRQLALSAGLAGTMAAALGAPVNGAATRAANGGDVRWDSAPAFPAQAKPITNDDVVLMVTNKIDDKIILTAIDSAPATAFDTTPAGLAKLRHPSSDSKVVIKHKLILEVQKVAALKQPRHLVTSADIVAMVAGDLDQNEILEAIDTASSTEFDVSPVGLVALKNGGVSDLTIAHMQDVAAAPAAIASAAPAGGSHPPDSGSARRLDAPASSGATRTPTGSAQAATREPAASPTSSGSSASAPAKLAPSSAKTVSQPEVINVVYHIDAPGKLRQLERQSADTGAHAGIFHASAKASIDGESSPIKLQAGRIHEFEVQLANGADPSKFHLFLFDSKNGKREVTVAKASGFTRSTQSGMGTVLFDIAKVSDTVYRFVLGANTPPGEYGFSATDSQEVFAFSLLAAAEPCDSLGR